MNKEVEGYNKKYKSADDLRNKEARRCIDKQANRETNTDE